VGGEITSIGASPATRPEVASITPDGRLRSWTLATNGKVHSLAIVDSTVYVAGEFTAVNGFFRSNLAAVNRITGMATSWNPAADALTHYIEVADGMAYVAGNFTRIGGARRQFFAQLDTLVDIDSATNWDPGPDGTIEAVAVDPLKQVVYVAGSFNSIGGQLRRNIAALDLTLATANATSWDPGADDVVWDIVLDGNILYAGGWFSTIGGRSIGALAALDTSIDLINAELWSPLKQTGQVYDLAISNGRLYTGGNFSIPGTNGEIKSDVASYDLTTPGRALIAWDPAFDYQSRVNALDVVTDRVHIGTSSIAGFGSSITGYYGVIAP